MEQSWYRDVGRHEADITTIKEDVREMRTDMAFIKEYITARQTERRLGWVILSAVGTIGGYVGANLQSILDFFKFKGL
jgi:hypothetical protein